jgi:hypothetical protein
MPKETILTHIHEHPPAVKKTHIELNLFQGGVHLSTSSKTPISTLPKPSSAFKLVAAEEEAIAKVDAPPTRKRNKKPRKEQVQPLTLLELKYLTVSQSALRYPGFSEKAFRHLIFNAEAYAKSPKPGLRSNGFIACVVRPGNQRKVMIDAQKFEVWLSSNQMGAQS